MERNLTTMSEFMDLCEAAITEPWSPEEIAAFVEPAIAECRHRAGVVWVNDSQLERAWMVGVN